jgi:hypothetical protein
MHEVDGELLIGGERLKHVHIELEEEAPQEGSSEWSLAGHMHLTAEQSQRLETDRLYRLELEDGRAGQVVLCRISPDGAPQEVQADFQPCEAGRRAPR